MIPEWVNEYVGLPFEEHGRTRSGVDCWGLVWLVYGEQFGIVLPSFVGDYETTKDGEAIQDIIERERCEWNAVSAKEARLGDVVAFSLMGYHCHVGLVVEPGVMLHCETGKDAVVEHYDRMAWNRKLRGIYRHKDMT